MDIDERNRSELKAYFVKNAIPTESNFADLIDAALNQKDDGVVKPAGNPLCIEASGAPESLKKAINFYDDFADAEPAWVLALNPRTKPNNPATAKAGFSIGDAAGKPRLFIDRASGNVGLGTVSPADGLDVAGGVRIMTDSNPIRFTPKWTGFPDRRTNGAEISNDTSNYKTLMIVGNKSAGGVRRVSVWDRLEVNGSLRVTGALELGAAGLVQQAWQGARLQNGWVNYSSQYNLAGYFKDSTGVVHLRGLVKNGAVGKTILTLPAGYRPERRELFGSCTNNQAFCRVDVLANGQVVPLTGNAAWLSIDGLTFRAK